jgi:protocatechuate 3,4-dioxygenase beta subunit
MSSEALDLSPGHILKLHTRAQLQDRDLYSFLSEKFPEIPAEDRLKYLAAILNDFFEEYRFDPEDEMSRDGYRIKRFYPRKVLGDASRE